MTGELDELQRRAYGRPVDERDAAAAQAELARLAVEERSERPVEWDVPRAPVFAVGGWRIRAVFAAAALLAAATAVSLPSPPGSLAVFDRPQTERDLAVDEWAMHSSTDSATGAEPSTVRWLANYEGFQAFGYRTPGGSVCIMLVNADGSAGSCTPLAAFASRGVGVGYGQGSSEGDVSVEWGPDGGPRFSGGDSAPSLEVFAAVQHGVPAWPGAPADDDDIRWLGSLGGWDVFGLLTAGGNVCVTAFADGASGGGSCTSRAAFDVDGLVLGTDGLTVHWGPHGGAQLDGARR